MRISDWSSDVCSSDLRARLGTSDPVEPVTDAAPLIESIDFARFGRAPARFDEAELALLNQKILHHTPHAAVAGRLPAAIGEARWNAIRPNLMTVDRKSTRLNSSH